MYRRLAIVPGIVMVLTITIGVISRWHPAMGASQAPPDSATDAVSEPSPLIPDQESYVAVIAVIGQAQFNAEVQLTQRELRLLEAMDTGIVFPGNSGTGKRDRPIHYIEKSWPTLAREYGIDAREDAIPFLVLFDAKNRLRYMQSVEAVSSESIMGFARAWHDGSEVYESHCARCHGSDGTSEAYPQIKTLDGIGKRMLPQEILDATWATGFANANDFTLEEQQALAMYVSGL